MGQQAAKESAPLVGAANTGIIQVYKSTGFKVADVAEGLLLGRLHHPGERARRGRGTGERGQDLSADLGVHEEGPPTPAATQ